MKRSMLKVIVVIFCYTPISVFTSCDSEKFSEFTDNTELSVSETKSVSDSTSLAGDTIVPFKGTRNRAPMRSSSYTDVFNELYDIREIPVYISVKENPRGGLFLTTQGSGREIVFDQYKNVNAQKFYIKCLPLSTGIPYLIYSYSDNTPVCIGHNTSAPDVKVLFTLTSEQAASGLWGASWDFKQGENTDYSFVIENQDILGGGPDYWNMYHLVIGANVNKVELTKYNKLATQEFEIKPVETFSIQSIEYVNDATATLSHAPYKVLEDGYTNNGNIEQSYTLGFTEEVTETSSHNKQTSISATISTEFKAGVPIFANGTISTSITSSTQFSYGKSSSVKRTISHSYPVKIPARHRAHISVTLFDNKIDMDYVATCKGDTSGRLITIRGRWKGVSVSESEAVLNLTSLDNPTQIKSFRINKDMSLSRIQ